MLLMIKATWRMSLKSLIEILTFTTRWQEVKGSFKATVSRKIFSRHTRAHMKIYSYGVFLTRNKPN